MHCTDVLISVIAGLRDKGLYGEARTVADFLTKYAQDLPSLKDVAIPDKEGPVPTEEGEAAPEAPGGAEDVEQAVPEMPEAPAEQMSPEKAALQYTLYHQFDKWHTVLDQELPKFSYLGEENIDALRSALSSVHRLFQNALEGKQAAFDKEVIAKWDAELKKILGKMRQSQKMELTPTKAKIDAFLLYEPTANLHRRFERVIGDDPAFENVKREFDSLMNVFSNIVKKVSEDIAKTDLTEIR